MNYYVRIPDWYKTHSPNRIHFKFSNIRIWLDKNVGIQSEDWKYQPGDLHAMGIHFKRGEDAIAFALKFKL